MWIFAWKSAFIYNDIIVKFFEDVMFNGYKKV